MKERGSRKRIIKLAVVMICLTAGVILWRRRMPRETEPDFVLFYAENQAEDYPTSLGAYKFAELVETRTDGRIHILVQANGALGTEKEIIRQMQCGGVDFARVSLSQLAEYIPEMNVLQMPYLYTDSDHMWRVLDGEIGDDFLLKVQDFELVGLSWYDAGARNFYNSIKPITRLEDIEGMRIRVQESELMEDMVEALGAVAMPLEYADVYANIERGVADGAENNWPSYESMSHYEVAKYYTVDEHTRVPEIQICSRHTWEKLSGEDRQIILECARQSSVYERQEWTKREERSRQFVTEKGVEIVFLPPEEKKRFQNAVTGVYEKYCGEYMDTVEAIIAEGK